MRGLVQSRGVIGVLIALYLCAGLAAIPVPTVVVRLASDIGLDLTKEADANGCACGTASACSTSGSCCCAAKVPEPIELAQEDDDDDARGFELLGMSCQPELSWLLAAAFPVLTADRAGVIPFAALPGERLDTPYFGIDPLAELEIEPAPPKLSA